MVPGYDSQARSVSLNGCLLEGDAGAEKRMLLRKRRAILISVLLQILVVAALLLIPLLGKGENLATRLFVPTVPYAPAGHPPQPNTRQTTATSSHPIYEFSEPRYIPARIPTLGSTEDFIGSPDGPAIPGAPTRNGIPGGQTDLPARVQPPPQPPPPPPQTIRVSAPVQAAMLLHRVDPVYPFFAIQTRREGRVELHAIISTDGTIQSLEVISGDPLLIPSALAAVREWRYRPTILNNQSVSVDTHITVIYTLSH